ncbi:hypothetical protein JCM2811A_44220 [Methylorubrum rhodinum]
MLSGVWAKSQAQPRSGSRKAAISARSLSIAAPSRSAIRPASGCFFGVAHSRSCPAAAAAHGGDNPRRIPSGPVQNSLNSF